MLLCTWSPDCDEPGEHRMERRASTPVLTVVETVCNHHTAAARRDGYEHRDSPTGGRKTEAAPRAPKTSPGPPPRRASRGGYPGRDTPSLPGTA
jgi:hypothetical protein